MKSYDTTDYGDMTLGKLDSKGVEFLLEKVEFADGQFGEFAVLIGKKDGQPFEIRAGGRAYKLFHEEMANLTGKVISIVPKGEGLSRTYKITEKSL